MKFSYLQQSEKCCLIRCEPGFYEIKRDFDSFYKQKSPIFKFNFLLYLKNVRNALLEEKNGLKYFDCLCCHGNSFWFFENPSKLLQSS